MKTKPVQFSRGSGAAGLRIPVVCLLLAGLGVLARAADTNSPTPMTPQEFFEGGTNTFKDWIELTTGGFLTSGNQAEAEQVQRWNAGAFGGIEDLHIQGKVFTNAMLTLDGRSIYDQHDYDLKLRLERQDKWYFLLHFDNFSTWFGDIGGFYPPTGTLYQGSGRALGLDRGEISFEAGVTPKKWPAITFSYTHSYREGEKSSTIWGPLHPDPLNSPAAVRGLYPSVYDIDETVDAFDLNMKKQIKKTNLGAGLHYEHGDLNDGLNSTFFSGEQPIPNYQNDRTEHQRNTYDLFSVNATSETWLKNNLMLSAGGMFANLDNNFSGSQIYGNAFGASYSSSPINGLGYYNMTGDSRMREYVMDLNLLAIPAKTFTITPSLRVQKETWDANSTGTGTLNDNPTESFEGQSARDMIDVTEGLEMRYTGVTNWVFSARGEWDERDGNLTQLGGLSQINGFGVPIVTNFTDDSSLLQKYSAGARWYPLSRLILDFGGYYKNEEYNYNSPANSTPNGDTYPGYFAVQSHETYDGNCRVTFRPVHNVTLVSRYEYQLSTVDTAPSPASGMGQVDSSRMTTHVIAQDVGWVPWSRLSLQAGFNYVLSTIKTPASAATAAILNEQNNYWTVNFSSGFVVDDKTTLNLNYFYFRADDYRDNSNAGVPLGSGAREHGVTCALTRRINPHTRLNLKYGYYNYANALIGGNGNFQAQMVSASLQYRF
jgi:hypothetical protein